MLRDSGGAAAILFALSLVPIMVTIGAAVDYTAANRMQSILSSSLDASTLSVAIARASGKSNATSDADLSAALRQALAGSLNGVGPVIRTSADATLDASGALSTRASLTIANRFLAILGIATWTVNARAKASAPAGPIEVALVLDTTGSMAGAKITALKQSATSLASTLFSSANASTNVKVGVVPFNYYVNVGLANRNATWLTGAQDYSIQYNACWNTYPNVTYSNPVTVTTTCNVDGVSQPCSYTTYQTYDLGAPVQQCGVNTDTFTWNGCVGSRNFPADLQDAANGANPVPALLNYTCASELQRLSASPSAVQTAIANLTAAGETYIAPGLLWGWRVLSPNPPFADGAAYGQTRKFLILMTDGANTHSPNYPDHEGADAPGANSLTSQTCAAIKAAGIIIYTVAFQVTDPTIKGVLQGCATSTTGYYDSGSIADMQAAFNAIGNSITSVRLVQ